MQHNHDSHQPLLPWAVQTHSSLSTEAERVVARARVRIRSRTAIVAAFC